MSSFNYFFVFTQTLSLSWLYYMSHTGAVGLWIVMPVEGRKLKRHYLQGCVGVLQFP